VCSEDPQDCPSTITAYIYRLKEDDPEAATRIWQVYFERLIPLARRKLRSLPNPTVDEDDVIVSVFDRLFRAAKDGRFAKLEDRTDLWKILLMLLDRKITDQYRRDAAVKRGGGKVRLAGDLPKLRLEEVEQLVSRDPDPGYIAEFNDHVRKAIRQLGEGKNREVALLRLEGNSNKEIASRLGISLSSVERKLRVIREVWEQKLVPDSLIQE
jgi:RNA polymerase sigma factor (sigma-70 family)